MISGCFSTYRLKPSKPLFAVATTSISHNAKNSEKTSTVSISSSTTMTLVIIYNEYFIEQIQMSHNFKRTRMSV